MYLLPEMGIWLGMQTIRTRQPEHLSLWERAELHIPRVLHDRQQSLWEAQGTISVPCESLLPKFTDGIVNTIHALTS